MTPKLKQIFDEATARPWKLRLAAQNFSEEPRQFTIEVSDGDLRSILAQGYDSALCPEHGGTMGANARLLCLGAEHLQAAVEALERLVATLKIHTDHCPGRADGKCNCAHGDARALLAAIEKEVADGND